MRPEVYVRDDTARRSACKVLGLGEGASDIDIHRAVFDLWASGYKLAVEYIDEPGILTRTTCVRVVPLDLSYKVDT